VPAAPDAPAAAAPPEPAELVVPAALGVLPPEPPCGAPLSTFAPSLQPAPNATLSPSAHGVHRNRPSQERSERGDRELEDDNETTRGDMGITLL
jgi:hypothetical protein